MFLFPTAARGRMQFVPPSRRGPGAAWLIAAGLLGLAPGLIQAAATEVAPMPAAATTTSAESSTESSALVPDAGLDDFIRFAMRRSPAVGEAFHDWRAAVARVPQARALPDPRLGIGVVLDQVETDARYMGERYSISQMFPWFGKLGLREDMAQQAAEAAARRYEAARLELVERVTDAWFEYAYLHEAAETAAENLNLMMHLESVARASYRTGIVGQADVNRAQVELGRLDNQVRSLRDQLAPTAAVLNAVLGRAAHAELPARPPAPSRQPIALLPVRDDAQWLEIARRENPRLAASQLDMERERRSVALAHKDFFPDITLGLEYARDGSARMARMDGGGADMVVGMVSINVPLRRGRYDAALDEAEARLSAAGHRAQETALAIETDLKRALFAYRDSERRLQLYGGTLVPKARQSLASTETAYRAGAASFSDLVDTQRVLLEFQLAHERAAADRGRARARVYALVGNLEEDHTP